MSAHRPLLARRSFLGAAAATVLLPSTPRARRGEDPVRVALVGLNERGLANLEALEALAAAEIVALCDVDEGLLGGAKRLLRSRGRRVPGYVDYRHLLDREDVEAVVLCTPNHWHALQIVWACQAGKDVFVEPPITHHLGEESVVRTAALRHGRVVATGLPGEEPFVRQAVEWLTAGNLGEVQRVHAVCFRARPPIGASKSARPIPAVLDYDLWTGPAPLEALHRERLHYDWRFRYDYGGGELADGAALLLDLGRRLLGSQPLRSARVLGGRFGPRDAGETPNSLVGRFDFGKPLILELRGLPRDLGAQSEEWSAGMERLDGLAEGVLVECDGGTLRFGPDWQARAEDLRGDVAARFGGSSTRLSRFLRAVRERKGAAASLDEALQSTRVHQAANLSFRCGQATDAESIAAGLGKESSLGFAADRLRDHLERNGVDTGAKSVVLGAELSFSAPGSLPDHPQAAILARGTYRRPYVLPDPI